ncbi:PH domain-containing protein [Agrobacterium tumefaciens]|nr:PH domain-containing protein [Agrobacterium tumefaciens]NTE21674.1 PH domain-containing protein [Agrobacterium tumefaciens]
MPTEFFTNEAIDIDSLPKYEEIVLKKPHHDYWKVMCISFFIWFTILAVIIGLGLTFIDDFKSHSVSIISVYLLLMLIIFILKRIGFKKRGYALRTRDVMYKNGIIAESTTIVPLHRIQHIELNEDILSRVFKLGTLQIFTAGGQSGHLHITGIPIDEARSIRDLILNQINPADDSSAKNSL